MFYVMTDTRYTCLWPPVIAMIGLRLYTRHELNDHHHGNLDFLAWGREWSCLVLNVYFRPFNV